MNGKVKALLASTLSFCLCFLSGCSVPVVGDFLETVGEITVGLEDNPDMTDEEVEEYLKDTLEPIFGDLDEESSDEDEEDTDEQTDGKDNSSDTAEESVITEEPSYTGNKDNLTDTSYLNALVIPAYTDVENAEVNNGKPFFKKEDWADFNGIYYNELDDFGRPGTVFLVVSKDTLSSGKNNDLVDNIKPVGWHSVKYDYLNNDYLYDKCNIVNWRLGAEQSNKRNLLTGTKYMVQQMSLYENLIADYIYNGGEYVYYRVTPVYTGNNLLCDGLLMEGMSDDDSLVFNVFYYNVQPDITIDYLTGESSYMGEAGMEEAEESETNEDRN